MTIHRALAELKVIDDRITKKIMGFEVCFPNRHSNSKVSGIPVNEFSENIKNTYKSIRTEINRSEAIKRAVTLSNAVTEVQIAGTTYRVAEAIAMKNKGIETKQMLLDRIRSIYAKNKSYVEDKNGDDLEKRATDYVQGLCGNKEKVQSSEVEEIRKTFIAANTYDLVDPIGCESVINDLSEKIDNFIAEVDSALSVSNAMTEIEFSYEVE